MARGSSIVRGRRRSNPQVTCCRRREGFGDKGGKCTPGGLERPLKMQRLNPDEGQRRPQSKQARSLCAAGQGQMRFEEAVELLLFGFFQFVSLNEFEVQNMVGFVAQEISEASGHTGAKV